MVRQPLFLCEYSQRLKCRQLYKGALSVFFALLEEVVKNQERQRRWERAYRAGLGALMLRCMRLCPCTLPVPSGTQCHQRIG